MINKVIEGRRGVEQMKEIMAEFRSNPPKTVGGLKITDVYDYGQHEVRSVDGSAKARPLPQPSGDMLIFHTEAAGTRFAARPSGTEPKIKFYLFARTAVDGPSQLEEAKAATKERLDGMTRDIEQFISATLGN